MTTAKNALVRNLALACLLPEIVFFVLWTKSDRSVYEHLYHDGFIIFMGLTGTLLGYLNFSEPLSTSKTLVPGKQLAKFTMGACLFLVILGLVELADHMLISDHRGLLLKAPWFR
jgi:hypothetical protein